jgi:hypothetical protein
MDNNKEKGLIIDKKYTCPVCDSQITSKAVKSNAARFVETKADLRPIYSNVNVTKYDTVSCPICGYTALPKSWSSVSDTQKKNLQEKVQAKFKPKEEEDLGFYTIQTGITRMKLALLCAATKGAKSSELGQICLKLCWLYQDLADEMDESVPDADAKRAAYLKEADNIGQKAYDYLSKARMNEAPPIAGMNEPTLDYILAYFANRYGDNAVAMKLLSNVIQSKESTQRLKDKALDLKEVLTESRQ